LPISTAMGLTLLPPNCKMYWAGVYKLSVCVGKCLVLNLVSKIPESVEKDCIDIVRFSIEAFKCLTSKLLN